MDTLVRAHRQTTDDEVDFVRLMMELISDIQDVDADPESPTTEKTAEELEELAELVETAFEMQCELEELKQDLAEAEDAYDAGEDDDGDSRDQLEMKIAKLESDLSGQPAAVRGISHGCYDAVIQSIAIITAYAYLYT